VRAERVPWGLAGLAVLAQICYPLADGRPLVLLTVTAVLLFAAAAIAHAALLTGAAGAVGLVLVAGGLGLLAESIGTATGFPFGEYAYSGTLGWSVGGVPLLIAAAWTMMAWPAVLAGRRLARSRHGWRRRAEVALIGGWVLAAWDLYLDPQMVAAGHWVFSDPTPALPGSPGIPLTNYAGWLLVSLVLVVLLDAVVPAVGEDGHGVPAFLLGWTWLGSFAANLVFFDRPAVAVWGFVGMGLVVGPYLTVLRRHRRRRRPGRWAEPRPVPPGHPVGRAS
jgi:putative membrane protein